MSKATLTQEITIPSNGMLNPEIPGGKLTQRCMMVYDQKYLAGGSAADNGLKRLLKETTVSPENFDVDRLTIPDTLFMLFKLRSLSYGDTLKYNSVCPHCGKKFLAHVDISKIEVKELNPNFQDILRVVLPVNGDTVYTRILTNKDLDSINEELDRLRSRDIDTEGVDYILRISRMIKRVELKEKDADDEIEYTNPDDIRKYVEGLTAYDASAILSTTENVEFGIRDVVDTKCTMCNREVTVPLVLNPQFFRPKFDIQHPEYNR